MSNTSAEVKSEIKVRNDISEPGMFKIIYLNDNKTTMDFVIDSLVEIFDYSPITAEKITVDIHEDGSAVVAVMPYEMAEQKGIEVTVSARANGFPLQIKLEPEND